MDKREKVYNKCSGKCDICGCDLHLDKSNYNDNNYTQIDHIYPKSLGGSDKIDNLRALCKSCNSKRRNRSGEQLLKTIVDNIEQSNLEYNQRLLFLKDDVKNGIISDEQLKKVREKMNEVSQANISIINELLH